MAGCYTTGGEDPGPVADIVRIVQEPATISPTDTVKFTMIIVKHHQSEVSYNWWFSEGQILNSKGLVHSPYAETDSTIVFWTPNGYTGIVTVTAMLMPRSDFDITYKSLQINVR